MKVRIVQKCRIGRKHRPVGEVLEFHGDAADPKTWDRDAYSLVAAKRAVVVDEKTPVGPPASKASKGSADKSAGE